jgi:hypothetical protein
MTSMNTLDGLKVLGAYVAGAAMALAITALFDDQPLDGPYGGLSIMMLNSASLFASGVLTHTKRVGEPVMFRVTVLSVLGVALVCAIQATVGWKGGVAGPLAFALFNAVVLPLAQAHGERRRPVPGALLARPAGAR